MVGPAGSCSASIAGVLMLQGEPLRDEDLHAAIRVRGAFVEGARTTHILRHGTALLIGASPRGAGPAPGGPAEDGRYAAVLSGRIDNAGPLRAELAALGAEGPMADDAAILREAVRVWGQGAAARLEGAFAFAVHDAQAGTLLCGRDRFGIAPFHYVLLRDRLVFASDLAAIVHWPAVRRVADHEVLSHYLAFGFCPVDHAPLQGVQRLAPAHTLRAERLRGVRCERYWTLPRQDHASATMQAEAATELRARLDGAVAEAARDAGPEGLGLILTGDATAAALCEAALRVAARGDGPEIHTFSLGSGAGAPPQFHAVPRSHAVPQSHAVPLDAACAAAALRLIPHRGEPFADPETLGLHALLAAAGERGSLCLSGAGGAELLLDRARYAAFGTALARHRDTRIPASARQGFHATMPFVRDLYGDLVCVSSDVQRLAMSGPGLIGALLLSPVDDLGASLERADAAHAADPCARIDLGHGGQRVLAPFEIARHGSGPVLRAPLLGTGLAEWCAGLPETVRLTGTDGEPRPGGLLHAALDRPPGGAASVRPALDLWLRTNLRELLEDTLASAAFRDRDLFRMSWIDRLVRDHLDGTRANGGLIWALLCLETWFLTFVDRIPGQAIEPAPLPWDAEVAA